MEDSFSVPFIGHSYCFYLQFFTARCFSFFYNSTLLGIKHSQHRQYTKAANPEQQEICLADTIGHINLHQSESSDKTHQNCEKPVMLPARVLIKKDIFPCPFQFLRCGIPGRPVINGCIFLRTFGAGFSSDKIHLSLS